MATRAWNWMAWTTTVVIAACALDSRGMGTAGVGGAGSGGIGGFSGSSGGIGGIGGSSGSSGGIGGVGGSSGSSGGIGGIGGFSGSSGGIGGIGGFSGSSGGIGGVAGTVAGVGGIGGVGGVGGVGGGIGGVGGVGGVGGGIGGTGGGDHVACPSTAPIATSPCVGIGQCVIDGSGFPGCRSIWECYEGSWFAVFIGDCVGPSIDLCPQSPEQAIGTECLDHQCVYEDGTICACEQPCTGVPPDPDTLRTACFQAARALCSAPKQRGDACENLGDTCIPSCCGTAWVCTLDGWFDTEIPCPP